MDKTYAKSNKKLNIRSRLNTARFLSEHNEYQEKSSPTHISSMRAIAGAFDNNEERGR